MGTSSSAGSDDIGSTSAKNLSDNISNLDLATNSYDAKFTDRFGRPRSTLEGLSQGFGFTVSGDFGEEVDLTTRNQLITDPDGNWWQFSGALPHTVKSTDTNDSSYRQILRSDHNLLTSRNATGSHDEIYERGFDTVADALAGVSSGRVAVEMKDMLGAKVSWRGYHKESDGGSNWGIICEGEHTHDGGEIFSINSELYIKANLKGRAINGKKYGITGDNDTADDDALSALLATNRIIDLINVHMKLTKETGFNFNSDIFCRNATFDFSSIGKNVFRKMLWSKGVQLSEEYIGDVTKDTRSIIFPGIKSVGNTIVIHNQEPAFNSNPEEGIKDGELFEIIAVSGDAITLNRGVHLDLLGATATVYEPTKVSIRGAHFIGNGLDVTENNETAIHIEFGLDNVFKDITTVDVEHYGIHVDCCLRYFIGGKTFIRQLDGGDNADELQALGVISYGIAIFNCSSEGVVRNVFVQGGKHGIDFTQNSSFPGYGLFNKVENCHVSGCWHAAVGTHDANTETTFTNVTIIDSMRGFDIRTPNNYFYNCNVSTTRLLGMSGGEGYYLTEDCSGIKIDGGTIKARTRGLRTSMGIPLVGATFTNITFDDVNGATQAARFDTALIDSTISNFNVEGDAFSTTALIDINERFERVDIMNCSAKGQVVDGDFFQCTIKGNVRNGDGVCIGGTGDECMVNSNSSRTGVPASFVGSDNDIRNNSSATSKNCKIRVTESGKTAIDVFDNYIHVEHDGNYELQQLFTDLNDGMFILTLAAGMVTVKHRENTTNTHIRTFEKKDYEWYAGTPLMLVKSKDGIFQLESPAGWTAEPPEED